MITPPDTAAFAADASGKRLVHGDTRGPNIMVRASGGGYDVRFIDFEFAGYEKEARYPLSLAPAAFAPVIAAVARSKGCAPEAVELAVEPISQSHDLALIEDARP
jgi:hypothetical protein